MSNRKSSIDSVYRLIASHAWMNENEAKVLLVMMYASGTKSLGLKGKGLKQFMERSLEKLCSDTRENLQEYLLKIKDRFPNNELLSED